MGRRLAEVAGLAASLQVAAGAGLNLVNPGFEAGETGWVLQDGGMSRIVPEAARSGKLGLRVVDESPTKGSSCRSTPMPITPGKSYAARFWARGIAGRSAVAIYQQYMDGKGRLIRSSDDGNEFIHPIPEDDGKWREHELVGQAPSNSVVLVLWIHSFNASTGSADLDDFSVRELSDAEAERARFAMLLKSRHGFPTPDPRRVEAIATWLPDEPRGIGRPIDDRAAWDRLAALPEAAGILKSAARLAETPPPDMPDELYLEFSTSGVRRNYERVLRQRDSRLTTLLLAECLEAKGRFIDALERDIGALCDEKSWSMPAHDADLKIFRDEFITIDLASSARAWNLATAAYWLGDRLSAGVRERIRAEVNRRVLNPFRAAMAANNVRGNWWMRADNNWNAVCTAGVVGAALALVEPPRDRAGFLAAMEISNPFFISGFTEDGYCSEGMGYWNYGFGHYVMMGLMVRDATGGRLDIFGGEKLKVIAGYARGYQIQPGRSPHFADGGGGPSADVWALMRQPFPDAVPGDAPVPHLLHGGPFVIGLRAFGQDPPPRTGDDPLPLRTWFPDAQVLLTRSTTAAGVPFGAAIKGGHNGEHHNHNDVGTYVVMLDGVEMLGDPGGEVYTRRTFSRQRYESKVLNSYGHPVPVVAGELQPAGRPFAATVVAVEFSDTADRLDLDLAAAYTAPDLVHLRRGYRHDRANGVIEIADVVRFKSPQRFISPLITYRDVVRVDDSTLLLHDGTRCVEVRAAIDGGAWRIEEESIENPGRPPPTRLAFTFADPILTGRIRFVIRPAAVPVAPHVRNPKPDGWPHAGIAAAHSGSVPGCGSGSMGIRHGFFLPEQHTLNLSARWGANK